MSARSLALMVALPLAASAAEPASPPLQVGVYPIASPAGEAAYAPLDVALRDRMMEIKETVWVDFAGQLPCAPGDVDCLKLAGSFSGVDRVLQGIVAPAARGYTVTLRLVDVMGDQHREVSKAAAGGAELKSAVEALACEALTGKACAPLPAPVAVAPDAPKPLPASAVVAAPPPLEPDAPVNVVPWILAGAAAVAAGGGAFFGVQAQRDYAAADGTDRPELVDGFADGAAGNATVANLLFTAAAAVAVGAAVTFAF